MGAGRRTVERKKCGTMTVVRQGVESQEGGAVSASLLAHSRSTTARIGSNRPRPRPRPARTRSPRLSDRRRISSTWGSGPRASWPSRSSRLRASRQRVSGRTPDPQGNALFGASVCNRPGVSGTLPVSWTCEPPPATRPGAPSDVWPGTGTGATVASLPTPRRPAGRTNEGGAFYEGRAAQGRPCERRPSCRHGDRSRLPPVHPFEKRGFLHDLHP